MSNKERGSRYERLAKRELEKEGFVVVKAGGSLGMFDLWAYGNGKLRLIQIKSVKQPRTFMKLQHELGDVPVDAFTAKELWIHRDRKEWKKIPIFEHHLENIDGDVWCIECKKKGTL